MEKLPVLYIVVPCYNEEEALPLTAPVFARKLTELSDRVAPDSRILLVDDGSRDRTWEIIEELAQEDEHFLGIRQSRNRSVLVGDHDASFHTEPGRILSRHKVNSSKLRTLPCLLIDLRNMSAKSKDPCRFHTTYAAADDGNFLG